LVRESSIEKKRIVSLSALLEICCLFCDREKYTLVFFEIQMTKKYYLEEDQLS